MSMAFRRSALAVVTATALGALAACGSSPSSSAGSPAGGTIQIGAIETISGPFAQIGDSKIEGAKLAVAQINGAGGVDGKKLVLVVKDEQASPDATVSDVRKLLGANIKLIFGGTTDSDCLAAAPLVSGAGGVMLGTSCQTNLLETTNFVPGFFEIAPTNYMLSMATAQLAATQFSDVKSWDGIGPDYEFGHEVWASFQADLKKLEPSVTFRKNVFVPLAETQFSSYITSLLSGLPTSSARSNGLFMSTFSATTIGLAQQGKSYNLFGRYKAVLNLGGSTPTAQALGANTPPLYFIYDYYNGAYNNPANTKFVSAFQAAHGGQAPNAWAYEGYTAVLAYAAAIKKAHSADPQQIIHAMAGMTFDTPKGELTFRPQDHLLESPVTVWRVVGDASAPGGFTVTMATTIPVDKVLPPVHVG
jgi:branched-chain amino acid transport system substrate-binding protein